MKLSDRNKAIMLKNYYEKVGCESLRAVVEYNAHLNNLKGLRPSGVFNEDEHKTLVQLARNIRDYEAFLIKGTKE